MKIPKSLYTKNDVYEALNRLNIAAAIEECDSAFIVDVDDGLKASMFKHLTLCAASRITRERERFIVDTLYQNAVKEMV